jgi:hypothetical protein
MRPRDRGNEGQRLDDHAFAAAAVRSSHQDIAPDTL